MSCAGIPDDTAEPALPLRAFSNGARFLGSNMRITGRWSVNRLSLLVLSVPLLFGCQTFSTKKDRAIAAYNQGNDLREAGRMKDSIPYYRKALEYEPEMAAAAYNLALALLVSTDSYSDQKSEDTTSREDVEESVEVLKTLLSRDSQNLMILRALGWANWKGGRLDAALEYYQVALAIFPADEIALRAICEIYESTNQPEKALENRKYLVELVNDSESRIDLARITALLGNKQEALEIYDDALFYEESIHALRSASEIAEALGFYRRAISYRIRLLNVGGSLADNWWHIARLRLSKIDDYGRGFEALERALSEGFSDKKLIEDLAGEAPAAIERVIRETVENKLQEM